MKRKDIIIMIATFILITIIVSLSFAFFAINTNLVDNVAQNVSFFDQYSANVEVSNRNATPITITNTDMLWSGKDELVANSNETFIINITNDSNVPLYCTYSLVWEWKSGTGLSNYTISTGATNEYTVSWAGNEAQVPNYDADSFVIGKHAIGPIAASSSQSFNLEVETRFYNLADVDQSAHYNKSYLGYVKIGNISCNNDSLSLTDYISYISPRSGTDAVSNSPWILTSDHPGEYRYAGKNPDNYISFNGELWRIIGVMPNMKYCAGRYGDANECSATKTGSLVKIIRNQTIGSSSNLRWDYKQTGVGSSTATSGSNDWSDSQLMLMLNGTNYLKTGYDVNGNKLHQSYTITSNVVAGNGYNYYNATYSYLDGNGTTVNMPSSATTSSYTATSGTLYKKIESSALSKIATVKWDLYGTATYDTAAEGSPAAFYNKERNINGLGAVYTDASLTENRPVYWYGKIGLMYPSDYGYATNGGSTYNRSTCLEYYMYGWSSGDYKTDCASNSYLWYNNITSTAPGTSGINQLIMSPYSDNAYRTFRVSSVGHVSINDAYIICAARPALYLNPNIIITGGTGKWNDPYTIASGSPKKYWFELSTFNTSEHRYEPSYSHPNHGGTLKPSGTDTGHNVYIGQDSSQFYTCASDDGVEVCLSQPYTQYGLSGHYRDTSLTTEQQNSAKQAIYQTFVNAGLNIDINEDCSNHDDGVACFSGYIGCGVYIDGNIVCSDDNERLACDIDHNGLSYCESQD